MSKKAHPMPARLPPVIVELSANGLESADEKIRENTKEAVGAGRGRFPRIEQLHATLEKMCERYSECGYSAKVIAVRDKTTRANSLPVNLFHSLPSRQRIRELRGSTDQQFVIDACQEFCKLCNPSCYVSYVWNRQLNRVEVLDQGGLEYPECIHSTRVNSPLVRSALFADDEEILREIHFTTTDMIGSFQEREGRGRVWCFQAGWDRTRIAILLNWIGEDPFFEPADLLPAARYLRGWMSSSRLRIARLPDHDFENPGTVLLESAAALGYGARVGLRSPATIEQDMSRLAKRCLRSDKGITRCRIHSIEDDANGNRAIRLMATDHGYVGHTDKRPSFPLPGPGQVPKQSIAAMSAGWRVPVLIKDIDDLDDPHHPLWSQIDVKRAMDCDNNPSHARSQLSVPVLNERLDVTRVIHLTSDEPNAFTRETVQQVSMLSHLLSSMELVLDKTRLRDHVASVVGEAFPDASDRPEAVDIPRIISKTDRWVGEHINENDYPRSSSDLLDTMAQYCLDVARVDHVSIQTYDPDARVFLPSASRMSNGCRKCIAKSMNLSPQLSGPKNHDVLEKTLGLELVCPRDGRTWVIFRDCMPEACWPVSSSSKPQPSSFSLEHFSTIVGLPLTINNQSQPDGVLWLRWIKCPSAFLRPSTRGPDVASAISESCPADVRQAVEEDLKLSTQCLIQPVIAVVAAAFPIFKLGELTRNRRDGQPDV